MTEIAIINAGFKPGLPDIDFAGIVRDDKPNRGRRTLVPAEIEQAEIAGGKRMTIPPGFKALTVVRNIAPGFRIRLLLPASEGQEIDVCEATAEAIFEAVATPYRSGNRGADAQGRGASVMNTQDKTQPGRRNSHTRSRPRSDQVAR